MGRHEEHVFITNCILYNLTFVNINLQISNVTTFNNINVNLQTLNLVTF